MNTGSGYLLIVEDDPDILKLLQTTLTFRGYRVVTARNGREGLDLVRADRPAIVIADIMMPKLDGFGLVHRLRLDPQTCDIPVVFITATYVAPEDKSFALSLGVTRFIEKPVNFDEFLPAVSDLLNQKETSEQAPLDEFEFYDGYRKRLETKLLHKNTQIARAEHLLDTIPVEEKVSFTASLRQAHEERREIQKLLDQIHEMLDNYNPKE